MPKDSTAKYYQGNKERLQKEEKRPYGREQHKNLPEDEKQKPVEYIERKVMQNEKNALL